MTVVQIISVISECVFRVRVRARCGPFSYLPGGRDSVGYNIGSENPKS